MQDFTLPAGEEEKTTTATANCLEESFQTEQKQLNLTWILHLNKIQVTP